MSNDKGQARGRLFGLHLDNIPLINIRQEFYYFLQLLSNDAFRRELSDLSQPVRTTYFWWFGMPDDLLTLLAQRAILGVESFLSGAAMHQAGEHGVLTAEVARLTKEPFSLGGRGTVANYYDRLPALVNPAWSLKQANPPLWEITIRFYKEIRNPLFHGYQISGDPDGLLQLYRFVEELYEWIDGWCPPRSFFSSE